jgi:hypothetical protein
MMSSQTGTLMGGKSGAKHEEFGFCMNQNWRYTSQVSRISVFVLRLLVLIGIRLTCL